MSGAAEITLFFGHWHPLLVHLPIGLVVLLAGLELLGRTRRFKAAADGAGYVLALAAPTAALSALCGWLLSRGGGYDAHLLQWHQWTGLGTAALCVVAALLYRLDLKKPYRGCLFTGTAVLVVTSHFGGSLTHGSDYLTRYAPQPLRTWLGGGRPAKAREARSLDPATAPAFAALIQPLFTEKCAACHGPEKAKGGLRLDAYAEAIRGGDSGVAIAPGKSADSLVIKRLLTAEEDENHMPPDGKPQVSAEELALLRWWIDAGASADAKVADLHPPADVMRIVSRPKASAAGVEKASAPAVADQPPPPDPAAVEKLADELDIALSRLAPGEPWLQGNASLAGTNFGDAQLAKLGPLGPNLRWLDLAGTRVTDAGLASLAAMPHLVRLHLERTAVTDAGLESVASLTNLRYLNLYGTAVTDTGLEALRRLPELKQLYLWQTKVTSTASQAFAEARLDRAQIQRWEDQVQALQTRIREAHLSVELGTPATAGATHAGPVNTVCPVSGKPVDPAQTATYDGRLVGFCCADCKAKFQADPKPFLAKLEAPPAKAAK